MSKASIPELNSLHAELAKALLKKLQDGAATAADLNVIRAFLKDNGVEAVAVPGSPIRALTDSLPYSGEDSEHTYQ